ncbi:hypothetical protein SAY87_029430 [Trapa incisa]|uniref:Uncharacterized protein n=1 Tax=Trapa incisa TaxID=236973 RepID=A0AAN7K7I1_9MYRT|nr:hypothetical protein SAY87_029430 [Trapa incisa]
MISTPSVAQIAGRTTEGEPCKIRNKSIMEILQTLQACDKLQRIKRTNAQLGSRAFCITGQPVMQLNEKKMIEDFIRAARKLKVEGKRSRGMLNGKCSN